ncbi:hypothetical protein UT300012_21400 [Paraclostridium bifermentans]
MFKFRKRITPLQEQIILATGCGLLIVSVILFSALYCIKELNNKALKKDYANLAIKDPYQIEEVINLSDKKYLDTLGKEGIVYYDDGVGMNSVDSVLNAYTKLPDDLKRLVEGTGFKVKLSQFLDDVDGVTYYGDKVILIEEFGDDLTLTTFHEFGHVVNVLGYIENGRNRLEKCYATENKLYHGTMRDYIISSPSEYYAGSFVEYMLDSDKLKRERPMTFKMIDDDVKSLKDVRVKEASDMFGSYLPLKELKESDLRN